MKKNTSIDLASKISRYTALVAAITGTSNINSQIIYTDIDDEGGVGVRYLLDMDNNGSDEFVINQTGNNLFAAPLLNTASLLGISSGGFKYPFAMDNETIISNSATGSWLASDGYYQTLNVNSCDYTNSQWCGVTDKYLGLRFNIGANTHYGWARLDASLSPGTGGYTIKDYAYNSTAGAPIMAGQSTLDINQLEFNQVKIIALNKTIALHNLPQTTSYRLYNLSGQSIKQGEITSTAHAIEANTLSNGVYFIEVKDLNSGATIRKKLIL